VLQVYCNSIRRGCIAGSCGSKHTQTHTRKVVCNVTTQRCFCISVGTGNHGRIWRALHEDDWPHFDALGHLHRHCCLHPAPRRPNALDTRPREALGLRALLPGAGEARVYIPDAGENRVYLPGAGEAEDCIAYVSGSNIRRHPALCLSSVQSDFYERMNARRLKLGSDTAVAMGTARIEAGVASTDGRTDAASTAAASTVIPQTGMVEPRADAPEQDNPHLVFKQPGTGKTYVRRSVHVEVAARPTSDDAANPGSEAALGAGLGLPAVCSPFSAGLPGSVGSEVLEEGGLGLRPGELVAAELLSPERAPSARGGSRRASVGGIGIRLADRPPSAAAAVSS
jgi:hypothetical protein